MPPKRKASYGSRAAQRRRLEENNPHPSQLTAHSAARENSQSSTGANPPTTPSPRSVNADWLANLGTTIAAAVQKSLQEAGIMVNNPQSTSQPDIQFIPDTPQSNNMDSLQQDGSVLTQTPAQAAIHQVTSNLIEGTKQPTTSKNSFISVAVPLPNRVSDKVKKQIWGNEYVDFAVIFHNSTSDDDQYTFKVQNRKGGQPTFSLEQSIKKQPIHTIDQWTAAFQAFVAVYSERFSSETAQLMKYGATGRDLAERGANWKFYDENFRMLRQK